MRPFDHMNAKSIADAVSFLQTYEGRAKIMAGGTDLLGILKDRILPDYPEAVLNLKTVPDMDFILEGDGGLSIGSLTRLSNIAKSPLVKKKYPLLAEAAQAVATPHIRRMGTIGGNLCQEVRCWYYRYPHHLGGRILCHRKGVGPCLAIKGDNRYNAILGGKACFAVSPSDTATALTALGAKVKVEGGAGVRTIPIGEFFTALGNDLKVDEILTEIQVPKSPEGTTQKFLKFTVRAPIDFAIVSVGAVVVIKAGICKEARIVLGAVSPTPIRAKKAEEAITGRAINTRTAEEAAEAAVLGARPLSMNAYKVELTRSLVKRAILASIKI